MLAEMVAFNEGGYAYLQEEPEFQQCPVISARAADIALEKVQCVAFTLDIAREGTKGMTRCMDSLTWFLRGRGSLPIKRCEYPSNV